MGVKGLLPDLRSITERVHLSRFRGQVAAVDALCWLHRGGVSCAKDLVEETSSTNGHITFCASMLDMLIENSIKPVLVFDGRPLLAKGGCNNDRKALREKNKEAARLAELNGNSELAFSLYKRAISVNSAMILQLIQTLKSRGIDFLVAPYEADAQLAFLSREGLVDLVISEDSDCLVFGCRRVLFKLDREGSGDLICRSDLGTNQQLNFAGWKDDQFRLFCCLAGCDYTSKIRGLGIKKAHKIVAEHRTFGAVITVLRGTYHIDDDAAVELAQAFLTYKHQVVFNPQTGQLEHLRPIDNAQLTLLFAQCSSSSSAATNSSNNLAVVSSRSSATFSLMDLSFLGDMLDDSTAQSIASGLLDPFTMQPYSTTIKLESEREKSSFNDWCSGGLRGEALQDEEDVLGLREFWSFSNAASSTLMDKNKALNETILPSSAISVEIHSVLPATPGCTTAFGSKSRDLHSISLSSGPLRRQPGQQQLWQGLVPLHLSERRAEIVYSLQASHSPHYGENILPGAYQSGLETLQSRKRRRHMLTPPSANAYEYSLLPEPALLSKQKASPHPSCSPRVHDMHPAVDCWEVNHNSNLPNEWASRNEDYFSYVPSFSSSFNSSFQSRALAPTRTSTAFWDALLLT